MNAQGKVVSARLSLLSDEKFPPGNFNSSVLTNLLILGQILGVPSISTVVFNWVLFLPLFIRDHY